VPGMFMALEGARPSANLMEGKAREAPGCHREVGSEGSVDQRGELTNRNWRGGAEVGRVRVRSRRPYPSRTNGVNPAVVHRRDMHLPRETCGVAGEDRGPSRTEGHVIGPDRSVRRQQTA
jgi:hypothetical protein